MHFAQTYHIDWVSYQLELGIGQYKRHAKRVEVYTYLLFLLHFFHNGRTAVIAQLGERKTEDLKVSGSIPDCGIIFFERCIPQR